ncbi:MAG: pyrroline-5-carboxylate reductase [Alphaproteobacteria bacterium]|jgi:pyrroline-5-carboxylate reductase|nr:pyrroline-5-carboxylate reductase [Alphaproteobacteria bacterium]MBT5860684.1 pyrroline-5-carboxylate reductase [Alphaproteobacteria bacterium]
MSLAVGRLLLVGCGKMGRALAQGWLDTGLDPENLAAVEPHVGTAQLARDMGINTVSDPTELADDFMPDWVVLAVKPQVLAEVAPKFAGYAEISTYLSVVAGKPVAALRGLVGDRAAIVRAMPNTPAAIRRGMSVAFAGSGVKPDAKVACTALLGAVGEVAWIEDEASMDAVTAVSGSGPAYVFLLIEALADAAVAAGLAKDLALTLAHNTVAGAGELALTSEDTAATLRRDVTSPGGTTEAALRVLMADGGLPDLMKSAVAAAAARSRELAG